MNLSSVRLKPECRESVRGWSDFLDELESSASETASEVVGLLGEVVDECVQPQ